MNKLLIHPTFDEEQFLWQQGYDYVIGLDEVGRGAFAGPVSVGAVVFSKNAFCFKELKGVNDSKLLNASKRKQLSKVIQKHALAYSIATVDVSVINKFGIGKATKCAFRKAIKSILNNTPNKKFFVLVDGNSHIPYVKKIGNKYQKAIVKGDQKSYSIAAASILAKVHRDSLMVSLHTIYPEYGFAIHKGYGTKKHQEQIKKHGLSKIHRTSFKLSCLEI